MNPHAHNVVHSRSRAAGLLAALVAGATLAAGCGPAVASVGSRRVRSPDAAQIRGPYVPAGQRFTVRLDGPVDTRSSTRNQRFSARLETPLRGANGAVLVPAGARVGGRVASLGSATRPRVRLEFDAIETVRGGARLEASLRDAQYREYPGPVYFVPTPVYPPMAYYSGFGYPGYGVYGWGAGWGGGPVYNYEPVQPTEVRLPHDARLNLVLTRPIYLPGTTVTDE